MTLPSLGKERRMCRLLNRDGVLFLLALDHPLTLGPIPGTDSIQQWIDFSFETVISGVVINRGALTSITVPSSIALVLQIVGMPDPQNESRTKIPIATVRDAIRASADCVSVQINPFTSIGLSHLDSIQSLVSDAEEASLPVMFMVNVPCLTEFNQEGFLFGYRVAAELGADIVKIPLPYRYVRSDDFQLRTQHILSAGPKAIMAGGSRIDHFTEQVEIACNLGFSGVCIGRNIIQSDKPAEVAKNISNILSHSITIDPITKRKG